MIATMASSYVCQREKAKIQLGASSAYCKTNYVVVDDGSVGDDG